jgi:hypothetical protein
MFRAFERLRHPEWAAFVTVPAGLLLLYATSPDHVFYRMVIAFTLAGAVPLWIEGRVWRRRGVMPKRASEIGQSRDRAFVRPDPSLRYPIITACIGQARPPRREEVRRLAGRIWREGLRQRAAAQNPARSFATRRFVFRAARAALTGNADNPLARIRSDNDL